MTSTQRSLTTIINYYDYDYDKILINPTTTSAHV